VSFEQEVGRLFEGQGYQVQHTARTMDGGVDLVLTRDERKTVVQCKAHAGRIGIGVGRELVASMQDFGAQEAILVAREGVTLPLKEYAEERGIRILELGHLLAMQSGSTTAVVLPAKDPEEMYRRLMQVKRERSRQGRRAPGG
jgi:restriction system protein